ncbi:cation:proton antiporter [Streptomyces sp. ICN988]|uniref:cation:proton antiporter domain-containing protein n=1 Tax=Streptomyces sp. ICN988 TaxID=2983765 RepID=UPI0021E44CF7|nr:cation:proton antiporter [Streptomyces sp. ICN988]MCV2458176.1 cation:proton antiporter [Streptomyces sp. ICN988]
MTQEVESLGWAVLIAGAVMAAALVFHPVSERIRVPAPAFFLLAAAVVSDLVPGLRAIPVDMVQQLVTVALIFVLLDGGASLGWRRLRPSLAAASWMGLAGTVVIAAATSTLAHLFLGFPWEPALLLGIALAPTDPAAVFSALGRKEIAGRSGTLLNGEAGLNDPAGIALLAGVLELGGRTGGAAVGHVALVFVEQIAVGAAVGVGGGLALLQLLRRVRLPGQGLYSLSVMAGALVIYGIATVTHGSGFLAVFTAGVVLADRGVPFEREIERFHDALSSLGEIAAFTALGLTVTLADFDNLGAWADGAVMAAITLVVVRPVVMMLMLQPVRLRTGERVFLSLTGLKGAVPILLGSFLLTEHATHGRSIYDIVFVVVAASILIQGTLIPWLARRCRVSLRSTPLQPWPLGVRFRSPPTGVRRYRVQPGAAAQDTRVDDLDLPASVWIALVIRQGELLSLHPDTRLHAEDEVVLITDPESDSPDHRVTEVFDGS